ncbi:MAG: hypothetical protein AABW51_04290 [Nanoarchaeota archaeon]
MKREWVFGVIGVFVLFALAVYLGLFSSTGNPIKTFSYDGLINTACIDSDGGINYNIFGSVTKLYQESLPLDTIATRIWLNTSLNTAKSMLTKSDLPNVLADYNFLGDPNSRITQTIKMISGKQSGGDNSGKVIFSKQPTSADDPVVGISIGSSQTSNPLYNLSATLVQTNFTSQSSEGQDIILFGKKFMISPETDNSKLVLFRSAKKISLNSDNPSTVVVTEGVVYTVKLVSASDTSATIKVTISNGSSETKEVLEGTSKKILNLEVNVVDAQAALKLSAVLIVGAEKIILINGATVTRGDNDDPIDGTFAYIVGGTGATTQIAITVFRPDSSHDAILPGRPFTDPVFGSFKIDFLGLDSPLDDVNRDAISVQNSGTDTLQLTMISDDLFTKTFDIAHLQNGQFLLGDNSNNLINVREMATLALNSYLVLGNENYGHIIQLYDIYNQTTGSNSTSNDRVRFRDVLSGTSYDTAFSSTEGSGILAIEGKQYIVTFRGTGDTGTATLKYPTSDSPSSSTFVVFPTIQTKNGSKIGFYQPLTFDLSNMDNLGTDVSSFRFPDGNGYTPISVSKNNSNGAWKINGVLLNTLSNSSSVNVAVGHLIYNFAGTGIVNKTILRVTNLENSSRLMGKPGLIIFEAKEDISLYDYEVMFVDLESQDQNVGVNDILFSSPTLYEAYMASDYSIIKHVDWFGTLASLNESNAQQKNLKINYPQSQVFARIYVNESLSNIYSDSCIFNNNTINLQEYYCSGGYVTNQLYNCAYGCNNGACNPKPPCTSIKCRVVKSLQ